MLGYIRHLSHMNSFLDETRKIYSLPPGTAFACPAVARTRIEFSSTPACNAMRSIAGRKAGFRPKSRSVAAEFLRMSRMRCVHIMGHPQYVIKYLDENDI
jgi:hypothetical protein